MRTARRVAWGAGIAVAVAAAAGGAALVADAASRPAPARSVGVVRWSDATAPSRLARTVTVVADLDGVRPQGCEQLTALATVRETTRSVRVRVELLGTPAPQGRICSASLRARLPVTARLAAPIGTRTLVDAHDGGVRPLRFAARGGER
jgi:hypothetical protein